MSILNQSITPHGKPAFPQKGNISTDATQQLSMVPLHHQPQSPRVFQLKKDILGAASAVARQEESFSEIAEADFENQKPNCMLDSIAKSVCKVPDLFKSESNLLTLPIAQTEDLKTHITMASDAQFEPFKLGFLSSLVDFDKGNLREDCVAELDMLSVKQNAILVVAISSAVKLERKQMDQIAKKVKRMTGLSNIRLENSVDPSLIAGFVISYEKEGSHVIDLSVKGQLAELAARVESTDQRNEMLGESKVH
ncbi:hypothetical protein ACLOJK_015837 [Asimina triloba]